jgi:L-lactate utilization protein LutB
METYEKKFPIEREYSRENREAGKELDEEVKQSARQERAEYLIREVKKNSKQIQNIMVHMQQVLSAVAALRTKLQSISTEEPASLEEDKKQMEKLTQKIKEHSAELLQMKDELIALLDSEGEQKTDTVVRTKTREEAEKIIAQIIQESSTH